MANMNRRCPECSLFACHHIRQASIGSANLSNLSGLNILPIGEHLEDIMSDLSKPDVIIPPAPSTKPLLTTGGEKTRLYPDGRYTYDEWPLCITCEKTRVYPDGSFKECYSCREMPKPQIDKGLQKINMQTDWVNCSICKAQVMVKFLDKHLKVHTLTFEPSVCTAIVKANDQSTSQTATTYVHKKEEEHKPSIKAHDTYKFRPLVEACFASSTSHDGRYSDFTIIFWEKEKPVVQSAVYSGGSSSSVTKDWERFLIHIVYDSKEDYYTMTSKLLKRSQYSTYDTEDTNPDRILFQDELQSEIKRALLFFRISPKAAYKHFRKLCKLPLEISYDKAGKAIVTQSENCSVLQERLKKAQTWTSSSEHNRANGYYDCCD